MDEMYVALLRGINVGGSNVIRMADLKDCFEKAGFDGVATFIQSGNVLFGASDVDPGRAVTTIEAAVRRRFGCDSKAVVLSYRQLKVAVDGAPRGFGSRPDAFRYDVIFLRPPLRPKELMSRLSITDGVDRVYAGKDVVYFSRLTAKAAQSRMSRIASLPVYGELTIRNWKTTTTLLELMKRA